MLCTVSFACRDPILNATETQGDARVPAIRLRMLPARFFVHFGFYCLQSEGRLTNIPDHAWEQS